MQPLPIPIPSTSPKPPKTATTPPGGSLRKSSASLRRNDTTDSLAQAERACVGYPVGRGVSKRIAGRVCRLGCGDNGRGGAEVDKGNLLSGGGGEAIGAWESSGEGWARRAIEDGMRRDWRTHALSGSGAARAADGERAGWLASITPR
ncbi:hypothetical protein JB92DRAFT_2927446 [Gautieria morchelliformis]|nr:hypothetical protein JB92DRAFT_2927446 [Gautieria morchelliformis]